MDREGPKKEHSPHKRGRIVALYRAGLSAREVAAQEGISHRAVYGIVSRYDKQVKGRSNPRSGRPPKLSDRDRRHIMRLIEANSFISNTELQ